MKWFRRTLPAVTAAVLAASSVALAQPATRGSELQVNTYTTLAQDFPAAAMAANGSFVVVWSSDGQDGDHTGCFGQMFDRTGAPRGAEFQVNTYTTDYQYSPAVAMDGAGNFVVVWSSYYQDGYGGGVFARMFDSSGSPRTGEFRVNTYTTYFQGLPSVGMDGSGNFVVAWESYAQDGSGAGVFARRFNSSGAPRGGEFQVNTYTTADQYAPGVAVNDGGDFVVVWNSIGQDGSGTAVEGRLFTSSGAPKGGEFQVNTYTTDYQFDARVSIDDTGDFVVVWTGGLQDGSDLGVFAQAFHSAGNPRGGEFQVNTYTTASQGYASVASTRSGDFVISWMSLGQDGDVSGVFAQEYNSNATPRGSEFQVNTYTTADQTLPAVALDPFGDLVVAWSSNGQDGDADGVFAQRFYESAFCQGSDNDHDDVCDGNDNCRGNYNPTQSDGDGDGVGDACDLILTNPLDNDTLDCSDPNSFSPMIAWNTGDYDRFKVFMSPSPGFEKGKRVTSGKKLLTVPTWTPPAKKWAKACAKAVAADAANPILYFRIFGLDTNRPTSDPSRKTYSDVVVTKITP